MRPLRRPPRRPSPAALLAAVALAAGASACPAGAQLFSLPVVQSPFPGRPFAVALDGGTASDGVRMGGVAIAAHRPAGRTVAALGIGRAGGFERARATYGARLSYALRFGESGALAAAPFAGYGVVARGDSTQNPGREPRLSGSLTVVPVGAGLGYRRQLFGRAAAVHLTPQAQWWRRGAGGGLTSASTWFGRVGAGVDVALTTQIGLSLAGEFGASTADVSAGPRGRVFGVALSYAPARRRR